MHAQRATTHATDQKKHRVLKGYSQNRCDARHRATCTAPRSGGTLANHATTANDGLRDGRRFRIATRPIARKCANRDDLARMFAGCRACVSTFADAAHRAWMPASAPASAGKKKPAEKAGFVLAAERSGTQWSSSSSSSA
jgi:hypothetical protein